MTKDQEKPKKTPEERRAELIKQLEKAREARKRKREELEAAGIDPSEYKFSKNGEIAQRKPSVKNLSKIVQEVLADPEWIDKVIRNQPDWWQGLPVKNAAYIMTTSMITMAMSGNLKAADWVRKTGFGEKVMVEAEDDSFFGKPDFTIQVIQPTVKEQLEADNNSDKVKDSASKLIDAHYPEEDQDALKLES